MEINEGAANISRPVPNKERPATPIIEETIATRVFTTQPEPTNPEILRHRKIVAENLRDPTAALASFCYLLQQDIANIAQKTATQMWQHPGAKQKILELLTQQPEKIIPWGFANGLFDTVMNTREESKEKTTISNALRTFINRWMKTRQQDGKALDFLEKITDQQFLNGLFWPPDKDASLDSIVHNCSLLSTTSASNRVGEAVRAAQQEAHIDSFLKNITSFNKASPESEYAHICEKADFIQALEPERAKEIIRAFEKSPLKEVALLYTSQRKKSMLDSLQDPKTEAEILKSLLKNFKTTPAYFKLISDPLTLLAQQKGAVTREQFLTAMNALSSSLREENSAILIKYLKKSSIPRFSQMAAQFDAIPKKTTEQLRETYNNITEQWTKNDIASFADFEKTKGAGRNMLLEYPQSHILREIQDAAAAQKTSQLRLAAIQAKIAEWKNTIAAHSNLKTPELVCHFLETKQTLPSREIEALCAALQNSENKDVRDIVEAYRKNRPFGQEENFQSLRQLFLDARTIARHLKAIEKRAVSLDDLGDFLALQATPGQSLGLRNKMAESTDALIQEMVQEYDAIVGKEPQATHSQEVLRKRFETVIKEYVRALDVCGLKALLSTIKNNEMIRLVLEGMAQSQNPIIRDTLNATRAIPPPQTPVPEEEGLTFSLTDFLSSETAPSQSYQDQVLSTLDSTLKSHLQAENVTLLDIQEFLRGHPDESGEAWVKMSSSKDPLLKKIVDAMIRNSVPITATQAILHACDLAGCIETGTCTLGEIREFVLTFSDAATIEWVCQKMQSSKNPILQEVASRMRLANEPLAVIIEQNLKAGIEANCSAYELKEFVGAFSDENSIGVAWEKMKASNDPIIKTARKAIGQAACNREGILKSLIHALADATPSEECPALTINRILLSGANQQEVSWVWVRMQASDDPAIQQLVTTLNAKKEAITRGTLLRAIALFERMESFDCSIRDTREFLDTFTDDSSAAWALEKMKNSPSALIQEIVSGYKESMKSEENPAMRACLRSAIQTEVQSRWNEKMREMLPLLAAGKKKFYRH